MINCLILFDAARLRLFDASRKPFQTISNDFKLLQTTSNHFKLLQTTSNYFKLLQTLYGKTVTVTSPWVASSALTVTLNTLVLKTAVKVGSTPLYSKSRGLAAYRGLVGSVMSLQWSNSKQSSSVCGVRCSTVP